MKKYAKWLVIFGLMGLVFLYFRQDKQQVFLFADNENGYFDETWSEMSIIDGGLIPSNEKLEAIQSLKNVLGVYPYIEMDTLISDDWEHSQTNLKVIENDNESLIILPKKYKQDETSDNVLKHIYSWPYASEDDLLDKFELVRKMDNCDSGIYITEDLCQALELDTTSLNSLSLQLSFYVPVAMSEKLFHYQSEVDEYGIPTSDDDIDFYARGYEIIQYQLVTYLFEIEGVIASSGHYLNLPATIVEEIMDSVQWDEVILSSDEQYFKPYCFLIELENKKTVDKLGQQLSQVIDKFVIKSFYSNEYYPH